MSKQRALLGTAHSSLLCEVVDGALLIRHWGAPLTGDIAHVELAQRPSIANSAFDQSQSGGIMRESSRGFLGRPTLSGHRNGSAWSTKFEVTDFHHRGEGVAVTLRDLHAELEIVISLELDSFGVLTQNAAIKNLGNSPYSLDEFIHWLPLPQEANQTLDFAGRWSNERNPQRRDIATGTWIRDSREGRSGHNFSIADIALTSLTTFQHGQAWATSIAWSGNSQYLVERLWNGEQSIGAGEIEKNWAHAPNPVFMLDSHGIVVLSSHAAYLYTASRSLSDGERRYLHSARQYGKSPSGGEKPFLPTPWNIQQPAGASYRLLSTAMEGHKQDYLLREEYLPEFDWTLMVTANLAPAEQGRWVAITIAILSSAALLFGALFWRQRERRVLDLRKSRRELEARVRERTQDLAERDAFRKAMEDSLLVGMRARDLEGRVTYLNPALCDITGYSAQDLLGRLPPYPYWHPEEFEKHWHDNDLALKGEAAPTGYESRFRHRLGHDIYVMVYTAPLIDTAGKHSGWMSSMVDITPQKKAEEAQRTQATKMQSTARLAIVGEMASTLAHELGNPLMAITSDASTSRIYANRGQHELLLEALGNISAQAQRAAEIVRRIRGFVRQNTAGFQACDVNALVSNVLSLLRPELRHQRAAAVVSLAEGLPLIRVDQLLLEQVILNLIVNAVQAMQEKAAVDKVVEIETGRLDDSIFIRVSDRGVGISSEVAEHMFAPFFTTKPEGLGLGLNICRTTVESHRGRLVFENRLIGGAVFTIYLPIAP